MESCEYPDNYKPCEGASACCADAGVEFSIAHGHCSHIPAEFLDNCMVDYCACVAAGASGDDCVDDVPQTPEPPPPSPPPTPVPPPPVPPTPVPPTPVPPTPVPPTPSPTP